MLLRIRFYQMKLQVISLQRIEMNQWDYQGYAQDQDELAAGLEASNDF